MSKLSSKLSKKDEMQLAICRERVSDVIFRCRDVSKFLQNREWPEYQFIDEILPTVLNLYKKLESVENKQFKLKYEL